MNGPFSHCSALKLIFGKLLGTSNPIVPQTEPDVFTGQQAKHRDLFVSFCGRACYSCSWKHAEQHGRKVKRQVWGQQTPGRKETFKTMVVRRNICKKYSLWTHSNVYSMMQISNYFMLVCFYRWGLRHPLKSNKLNQNYYPQGWMCYITEPICTIFKSLQSLKWVSAKKWRAFFVQDLTTSERNFWKYFCRRLIKSWGCVAGILTTRMQHQIKHYKNIIVAN